MRAIAAAAPWVAVCGGAPAGPASAIPADAGVTPGPRQTCEQLRSAVEFIVFDLVAEHASGCLRDDDCILVSTSLPCMEGCETAVVAGDSAAFLDEFHSDGAAACATLAGTCGFGPNCAQVAARCVNGGCHPVPVTQIR